MPKYHRFKGEVGMASLDKLCEARRSFPLQSKIRGSLCFSVAINLLTRPRKPDGFATLVTEHFLECMD